MTTPFILTVPTNHPLSGMAPISASAERRREIQRIEEEIVEAAIACGWRSPRRREFSKGHSVYVELRLRGSHRVVVRISDHSPARPFGGVADEWPTLVVIVEAAGAIRNCIAWLKAEAEAFRNGSTTIVPPDRGNGEVDAA